MIENRHSCETAQSTPNVISIFQFDVHIKSHIYTSVYVYHTHCSSLVLYVLSTQCRAKFQVIDLFCYLCSVVFFFVLSANCVCFSLLSLELFSFYVLVQCVFISLWKFTCLFIEIIESQLEVFNVHQTRLHYRAESTPDMHI